MTIHVLNPTYDEAAGEFVPAPRLHPDDPVTVGIVSNGKHGTRPFFDALADELQTSFGIQAVVRVVKPNYSAPAGDDILDEAKRWNALVSGIGD